MKYGKKPVSGLGFTGFEDGQDLHPMKISKSADTGKLDSANRHGWEIKKLGDVCKVIAGQSPEGKFYNSEGNGLPFYQGKKDYGEKYIGKPTTWTTKITKEAEAGDILISVRAPVGPVNFATQKICIGRGLAAIRAGKSIDKEFLFNFFLKHENEIVGNTGAVFNSINKTQIENLQIPLPPLPEQQRIVSILDEAFAAIAKAKANAEQNLKNARELFESYLQGVFEDLFQSRETKSIAEIAKVIGGYSFKSTDFKKAGNYQVIRMGNVRPGIIRENESAVFIDKIDEKALSKALLIPKDVIITQTGTKNKRDYGFTVIIVKENYLLNQRIAAIRFSSQYLPEFFLYFSWTKLFKDQYFANETGTVGQGNVGIGAITESKVPYISIKEQQSIVRQIDALRAETQKLEAIYQQKLLNLEELKKSILQKAFSGELMSESGFQSFQDDMIK
jgi:type I restriction enzyme, S subunit